MNTKIMTLQIFQENARDEYKNKIMMVV